jgi:regulator of replication initiation timing
MTQKLLESEKSGADLLQAIDPKGIADESMRRTVESLLNLIEELNSKVKKLESENQRLRDENNRLKGEQGKPDIKAKNKKGLQGDHSSEKERQTPKEKLDKIGQPSLVLGLELLIFRSWQAKRATY